MRKIILENDALDQYNYWVETNNTSILNKIKKLIDDIQIHPFIGIGKPEPLKNNLSGFWSRRITKEHRLIYKVENNSIVIVQCKFHY